MKVLQQESNLDEIVKLVGMDALSPEDRLTMEVARSIREDFLQQDAFGTVDAYTPLDKQLALMKLIHSFEEKARRAVADGADIQDISDLPVREQIGRAKALETEDYRKAFAEIDEEISKELNQLLARKSED